MAVLKLTLTEDGVVLDEVELTRAEFRMAQRSSVYAKSILCLLQPRED